jgi:type IV pilus assembly protein PilO
MSLRDPKVLRVVITLALAGVALWGFFLSDLLPFGYSRRARQTRELRASYETVSTELEKARRSVGDLPQLEKEHAELERKWKQAEALLPTDKEVAHLLTQITQAGEQAGVTFELFKPQASKPQEFYNENPVDIKVEGGFHQVGIFLARVANLPRIVNVTGLQLEALPSQSGGRDKDKDKDKTQRGTGERTDHTLKASFTATAYSLRDVIAEPAQGPPAETPGAPGRKGARLPGMGAAAKARTQGAGVEAAEGGSH